MGLLCEDLPHSKIAELLAIFFYQFAFNLEFRRERKITVNWGARKIFIWRVRFKLTLKYELNLE